MEILSNYKDLEMVNCRHWLSIMQERLYLMLENEYLCDIFLSTSDGLRIGAHKNVLSASSTFFWSAFVDATSSDNNTVSGENNNIVGSRANGSGSKNTINAPASNSATTNGINNAMANDELHLIDIDGKVLKLLVSFCYTGRLELSFETISSILKVARDLKFHTVIELCCEFLLRHLNAETCCLIESLAISYSLGAVADITSEYILNNFHNVSQCDGFLLMTVEKLGTYLRSDNLVVPSEEDVFHAFMRWTLHNSFRRLSYVHELLPMVRLTELKDTFLFDEVQNFAVGNHCSQLIIDALNWKFIPNRRDEINTKFETRPRKYNMGLLAIGGIDNHAAAANTMASSSSPSTPAVAVKGAAAAIDGAGGLTAVERYSYITNEWTQMQCNLELPVGCAIVELNGELIILGGCQQKNRSISNVRCVKFNSSSAGMQMTAMPNMQAARAYHGAVVHNGQIYVAGGRNGSITLMDLERYDSTTEKWCQLASMSIGRFDFNLNIVKGSLYAIGGTGGPNENQPNVSLATVECYHPAINEWSSVADMNRRRCQAASAVHNSRIYVFGGCDNENELIGNLATDTVECYNVDKNEWTMVTPMTSERYGLCATAAIDGSIIVVGGRETFGSPMNCVEKYDVKNNNWSQLATLNWPRSSFHLALVKF